MCSKLFICHTVYHVYITLLKQKNSSKTAVALVDTIQNYQELSSQLKKSGLFCDVILIDRSYYFGKRYNQFLKNYLNNRVFIKSIDNKLKWINEYREIYIYNDYSEVGDYLEISGKKYHLIEDGLDVFKQFDVYEDIGHGHIVKKILYKLFKIPYSVGMNQNCVDIEVNDRSHLKTALMKPIVEVKREELEQGISPEYLNKIYEIFEVKEVNLTGKKLLLLTQVLKEILVVKSDVEQIEFYRKVLKSYSEKYQIYIKAHPRDNIDYSIFENEYGAICLKKEIPMEVYGKLPGMTFDMVVTYSSTSGNMQGLGERVVRLDERIEKRKSRVDL